MFSSCQAVVFKHVELKGGLQEYCVIEVERDSVEFLMISP